MKVIQAIYVILIVLQILFILLKAFNKISGSWWTVFVPLYLAVLLSVAIVIFVAIIMKELH